MNPLLVFCVGEYQCKSCRYPMSSQVDVICLDLRDGMSRLGLEEVSTVLRAIQDRRPTCDAEGDNRFDADYNHEIVKILKSKCNQIIKDKFPKEKWLEAKKEGVDLGYADWVGLSIDQKYYDWEIIRGTLTED